MIKIKTFQTSIQCIKSVNENQTGFKMARHKRFFHNIPLPQPITPLRPMKLEILIYVLVKLNMFHADFLEIFRGERQQKENRKENHRNFLTAKKCSAKRLTNEKTYNVSAYNN